MGRANGRSRIHRHNGGRIRGATESPKPHRGRSFFGLCIRNISNPYPEMTTNPQFLNSISSQQYNIERERLEKRLHSAMFSGERDDERQVMAEITMLDLASGTKKNARK